jgi:hypothetical protein
MLSGMFVKQRAARPYRVARRRPASAILRSKNQPRRPFFVLSGTIFFFRKIFEKMLDFFGGLCYYNKAERQES